MAVEMTPREVLRQEAANELRKFLLRLSNEKDLSGMDVLYVIHVAETSWLSAMVREG